ncbi:MAG: hypothetical protein F4Z50_13115, partial [Gemmatimonadetes bacterium]|nr:hypothetical protein [Gemmatimonadota bacterium]
MVNTTFGKVYFTPRLTRRARSAALLLALATGVAHNDAAAQERRRAADTIPTLGLELGVQTVNAGAMRLDLVSASQTVAALRPGAPIRGQDAAQAQGAQPSDDATAFDFTPADWLERRAADGYFHLGDLTLRLRWAGSEGWRHYSTAAARQPVQPLPTQ